MIFTELKNKVDFYTRNFTKFSRKNFTENRPDVLFRNQQENEYIYDILARYFSKVDAQTLRILDIGSKNWFYAKGEHKFFNEFCEDFLLEGVEIDAYRLYSNFYSRFEVAKFYTRNLENTNYIVGNLLDLDDKYDYIVWILPFVFIEPLRYWGLPMEFFEPEKLLSHAYEILRDGGQMLIINQGELEAEEQEKLFKRLNIPYENLGEVKSEFFAYRNKRFGWLVTKYY